MERVTIMLAGYSRPYPFRKEIGAGDRAPLVAKTNSTYSRGTSRLAWLYSNGGINQLKSKFYIPKEIEVFPYEHSNRAAHNTRDLENIKLPGGDRASSKVSDEVVCALLKKIWFDLHPVNDPWEKMTFKPALEPVIEVVNAGHPTSRPPSSLPTPSSLPSPSIPKENIRKTRARKVIQAIGRVLKRVFPGRKRKQA